MPSRKQEDSNSHCYFPDDQPGSQFENQPSSCTFAVPKDISTSETTLISLYPILCSPEALLEHRISPGIGELQSLVPPRYSLHGSATLQRDVLDLLEMHGCVQASVSPDRLTMRSNHALMWSQISSQA